MREQKPGAQIMCAVRSSAIVLPKDSGIKRIHRTWKRWVVESTGTVSGSKQVVTREAKWCHLGGGRMCRLPGAGEARDHGWYGNWSGTMACSDAGQGPHRYVLFRRSESCKLAKGSKSANACFSSALATSRRGCTVYMMHISLMKHVQVLTRKSLEGVAL